MKGLYREEIVAESLKIYPCGFCQTKPCTKKCRRYLSCHNIYTRIGKGKGYQLLDYLKLCSTETQAMEAILQYNKY